jgi:signal transduction histidine kinase
MVAAPRPAPLRVYLAATSAAGLSLAVLLALNGGLRAAAAAPTAYWLLVGLLVASELAMITVPHRDKAYSFTISTTFAVALLLGWGLGAAVVAYALASVVGDLAHRRPPRAVVFNASQYTLTLVAAAAAYGLLGGQLPFAASNADLLAFLGAAIAFLLANNVLVRMASALSRGPDLLAGLRDDLRDDASQVLTSTIMFAVAPVTLLVATARVALLLLFVIPLIGLYVLARIAVNAQAARLDAVRAAKAAEANEAEQRRLAAQGQVLAEQFAEAARLKSDLLATISHEFRTPLTAALGALTTLVRQQTKLPPGKHHELLVASQHAAERLDDLVQQALIAADCEQQVTRRSTPQQPIDLVVEARGVVDQWRGRHPDRRITLVAEADLSLPVQLTPDALRRVLANLIDNAVKHAPGSPGIPVEVLREGGVALVVVEDGGPGISAGDRDKVFEWFTQLDSSTTRPVSGLGLGLYVARELARAYGGDLLATDPVRPGHGARFELRLPTAPGS